MTTPPGQMHFHIPTEATGTEPRTTETTTTPRQVTPPQGQNIGEAGPSMPKTDGPSAQQIMDLNFYLKKMTIGNADISQIESFGGGSDYEMFLDAVSSTGVRHGWSEAEMLRTVEIKLKDKAREYYGALLPSERPTSMLEMKQWFRRVFARKLTINAGKRELERCIRVPGEPLGEFAQRLKVVVNKMFPSSSLIHPEKIYHRNLMLVNQFIEGLDRRLANEILRAGEFYNLEDCLEAAEECEEIVSRMIPETRHDIIRRVETNMEYGGRTPEEARRNNGQRNEDQHWPSRVNNNGRHPRGGYRSNGRRPQANGPRNGQRRSTYVGGMERRAGEVRRLDNAGNSSQVENWFFQKYPYMKNRCRNCGQEGHSERGCYQAKSFFCYHCGKVGEICNLNSPRQQFQNPS